MREKRASSRWDRIALPRHNPRERKVSQPGCSGLYKRPAGLQGLGSNVHRRSSGYDYGQSSRTARLRGRADSGLHVGRTILTSAYILRRRAERRTIALFPGMGRWKCDANEAIYWLLA